MRIRKTLMFSPSLVLQHNCGSEYNCDPGYRMAAGPRNGKKCYESKSKQSMLQSKAAVRIFSQDAVTRGHSEKTQSEALSLPRLFFSPIVSAIHVRERKACREGSPIRRNSSSVKCSHSSFAYCFPILMLCPPSPPLTVLTLYYCAYNVRGSSAGDALLCPVREEGEREREKRRQREATRRPIVSSEPRFFSENENKVMVATTQPTFHLARSSFFFLSLQVLLSRNWDANERLQDSPPSPSDSSSSNSPYPYPSSTTPNPRSRQFPISFPKRKKEGGELAFLISLATFCSPTFPLPFLVCLLLAISFHRPSPPFPPPPLGRSSGKGGRYVCGVENTVYTHHSANVFVWEKKFFSPPLSVA